MQAPGTQSSFNLTVTPASAPVLQNQPATFSIQVAPVNGFTGNVNLAVNGGGTSYTVTQPTPNPVNLTGATASNATFNVSLAPGVTTPVQTNLTVTATGGTVTQTATVTVLPQ